MKENWLNWSITWQVMCQNRPRLTDLQKWQVLKTPTSSGIACHSFNTAQTKTREVRCFLEAMNVYGLA
jgi:hypothetical protein